MLSEVAQDLRQVTWTELAGSAGAVGELRQPLRRIRHAPVISGLPAYGCGPASGPEGGLAMKGVISVTVGKYAANRALSRVSKLNLATAACAPM